MNNTQLLFQNQSGLLPSLVEFSVGLPWMLLLYVVALINLKDFIRELFVEMLFLMLTDCGLFDSSSLSCLSKMVCDFRAF